MLPLMNTPDNNSYNTFRFVLICYFQMLFGKVLMNPIKNLNYIILGQ